MPLVASAFNSFHLYKILPAEINNFALDINFIFKMNTLINNHVQPYIVFSKMKCKRYIICGSLVCSIFFSSCFDVAKQRLCAVSLVSMFMSCAVGVRECC